MALNGFDAGFVKAQGLMSQSLGGFVGLAIVSFPVSEGSHEPKKIMYFSKRGKKEIGTYNTKTMLWLF